MRLKQFFAFWTLWAAAPYALCDADTVDLISGLKQVTDIVCSANQTLSQTLADEAVVNLLSLDELKFRDQTIGEKAHLGIAGLHFRVNRIAPHSTMLRTEVEVSVDNTGVELPRLLGVMNAGCIIEIAREIEYDAQGNQQRLVYWNSNLTRVESTEPLDAEVPAGSDPGGVLVGHVDSGVNYLLPFISSRLARDTAGAHLGYDYWDLDARPFDSNPARSPFFPQRHGTKTASVILSESATARLVAYRYPRPDMSRMEALVADAASKGVTIMNLSLGSRKAGDWQVFKAAARTHSEILFVVSAGNEGVDIDQQPVYPATFTADNIITVTSTDEFGRPAPGANWGRESVDVGVPAEDMIVTGFSGYAELASGSSYAAARISALAACLKAAQPQLRGATLKASVLAFVEREVASSQDYVRVGYIPDPDSFARGACSAGRSEITTVSRSIAHASPVPNAHTTYRLKIEVVRLEDSGWSPSEVAPMLAEANLILAQCDVALEPVPVVSIAVPEVLKYYHPSSALQLVRYLTNDTLKVFLIKDSLKRIAFDAEAIGRSNSEGRHELQNTVWITQQVTQKGTALAHEIAHVLIDSGEHVTEQTNLMNDTASEWGFDLTNEQCDRIREMGTALGLLTRSD